MSSAKDTPAGFLNINKPLGLTSHDVVAKIRHGLKVKKVGHAGTLDPLATGVLVVCLGYATRLSEYAMASTKRYHATVHLGIKTDTYDAEGEVIAEHAASHITRDDVEALLPDFTGDIAQLPPMYSAIKKGGRKLYEMARAGETIEREARPVTIHALTITDWSPPQFGLDVVCGSGTYIRSLAHDIGERLEVGAHLAGLMRVSSGAFHIHNAVQLEDILGDAQWQKHLLPPDTALTDYPALNLDENGSDDVLHGRPLPLQEGHPLDSELMRVYSPQGQFLALLELDFESRLWRPHKVFQTDN